MANQDSFINLLSYPMRNDMASFVDRQFQAALLSQEGLHSLQDRFCVSLIGLNKAGMPTEHESLAIWVYDRTNLQRYEYVIERVPAPGPSYASRFASFSTFPKSEEVLRSLTRALRNMRSLSTEAAESLIAAITVESDSTPLLPISHDLLPLTDSPTTTSLSPRVTPPPPTELTLIDTVSSSLVGAVALARLGSQSVSPRVPAEDSISARPLQTLMAEDCIQRFNPVELSLFEVTLLGKIVHDYAPMYGLFDNHCYMFASVMFDAIVQLRSLPRCPFDPSVTSSTPVPAPTPQVRPPRNANVIVLPDGRKAGRWCGLLVIDPTVKATIVSIVMAEFDKQREFYMRQLVPAFA
jgi:hypothetical protein